MESQQQQRIIAIGDIHGHILALRQLINKIQPTQHDQLILLGDYIDRGPHSYEVLEFLIKLRLELPKTIFLRGNHDQWLLNWLFGQDDTFLYLGGRQTQQSYVQAAGQPFHDLITEPKQLLPLIPKSHLRFLDETVLFHETEDCIFVHGGLDPAIPEIRRQNLSDLLMGHRDFFQAKLYPKKIVVGHTSTQIFGRLTPVFLPNNIVMVDTSYGRTGRLSAVSPITRTRYQINVHEQPDQS